MRLNLLLHVPSDVRGQVLSVVLEPDGPAVGETFVVPAVPHAYRVGMHSVVAAHDGADAFAVARAASEAGRWFVDVRDLSDDGSWRSVAIPHAVPAALHIAGDHVVVGHAERLSAFRLSSPKPSVSELRHRAEMRGKAYDVFARHRNHLVAIDDIRRPFFADSFDLAGGDLSAVHGFELPALTNGHYAHAALLVDSAFNGRLFAITPFAVLRGSGRDLLAIPFTGGKPSSTDIRSGGVARLEEMVARPFDSRDPSLLAGDVDTPWSGIAAVADSTGGKVLIAAGARGLLSVPADFDSTSKVAAHDLGGEITDVLAHEGRVWALRAREEGATLLELDVASGPIGVSKAVELDAGYRRFVR